MGPGAAQADELIEFWTLLDEDREELAGKRGAIRRDRHEIRLRRPPRTPVDAPSVVRQLDATASE
jgi:hypothetical protein